MSENQAKEKNCVIVGERMIPAVRHECAADFTLPDYMGDIKRVLSSSASVTPINKFLGQDLVSFLSEVSFEILYLDSDDVLTEATFTTDVEHTEKISIPTADADIVTSVGNVAIRLQGPRKISAAASLSSDIYVSDKECGGCSLLADNAEKKYCKAKIHTPKYLRFDGREFAEELAKLESCTADEVEAVSVSASAYADTAEITDGFLTVSGFINAEAIVRVSERLKKLEAKIPFTERCNALISDTQGLSVGVRAYASDCKISVNNESSESGAYVSVVANVNFECFARLDFNTETELLTDAFVPAMENECEYKNYDYREFVGSVSEKRKIEFTIARDEYAVDEILLCDIQIKNPNITKKNGEVSIDGTLIYNVVALGGDGVPYSRRGEREFTENIRYSGASETAQIHLSALVRESSVMLDNEKIYIGTMLDFTVSVFEDKTKNVIVDLKTSDVEKIPGRRIIVYYPGSDECAWDIAKKYKVSLSALCNDNPGLMQPGEHKKMRVLIKE